MDMRTTSERKYLEKLGADLRRAVGDDGTSGLQGLDLVRSSTCNLLVVYHSALLTVRTLATSNDSTSVAHATARGSRTASNEADNRLRDGARLVVLLKVLSRILLH